MRFAITGLGKKELNKFLPIANGKSPMPVLANLLLVAQDETLTITACNLETSVVESFRCDMVEQGGAVTVEAKRFVDILDRLNSDEPIVVSIDKSRLSVSQNSAKFQLSTIPADDYPQLDFEEGKEISVDGGFIDAIKKTVYAASNDNSRFNLNTVCVDGNKLIATDGHRLSMFSIDETIEEKVLLPTQFCYTILKSFIGEGSLTFGVSKKWAYLGNESVKIYARLPDGDFPDYTRVIPQDDVSPAIVDKKELQLSIKRVAPIVTQHDMGIEISVINNGFTVKKQSEIGSGEDSFLCDFSGSFSFIANLKYITECLANIDTDRVLIKYFKEGAPVVFLPEGNDKHYALVMPMRK